MCSNGEWKRNCTRPSVARIPCKSGVSAQRLNQRRRGKMIDWLLPDKHAIALIIKDHETVKDLFDNFEKADTSAVKKRIADQAIGELKMHDIVEKEIFYPAVRQLA